MGNFRSFQCQNQQRGPSTTTMASPSLTQPVRPLIPPSLAYAPRSVQQNGQGQPSPQPQPQRELASAAAMLRERGAAFDFTRIPVSSDPNMVASAKAGPILSIGQRQQRVEIVQRQDKAALLSLHSTRTPQESGTSLPTRLKTGIETLSGVAMDDVQVHYHSAKPASVQASAYTQGTNIHVAPGQERHVPHEAWHVVQQKQGRVKPTLHAKGVALNDDQWLEREADVMGERATQLPVDVRKPLAQEGVSRIENAPIQRMIVQTQSIGEIDTTTYFLYELRNMIEYLRQEGEDQKAIDQIELAIQQKDYRDTSGDIDIVDEEEESDEDLDYEEEGYKAASSGKKPQKKRARASVPDKTSTFGMYKPKKEKVDKTKQPSKETQKKLEQRGELEIKGGMVQRPKEYGPVSINMETIKHVSQGEIRRPVNVSGLVYPTTTSGRPSAPEPSSGIKVGVAWKEVGSQVTRNTGIVDAQKGHIMALELGGPDIPVNIVSQFANWQANGAWRMAEKKVLALAQTAEKKGHKLHFEAQVIYKQYRQLEQATIKGLLFPTAFKITVTELDAKGAAISSGTAIFNEQQSQDQTDFKISGRVFDEIDTKEMSDSDTD